MKYVPGASCGNSYCPLASVEVWLWKPVALLSNAITVPGTTAPRESKATPLSDVVADCAHIGLGTTRQDNMSRVHAVAKYILPAFVITPPGVWGSKVICPEGQVQATLD
jgi:hypothetical protein